MSIINDELWSGGPKTGTYYSLPEVHPQSSATPIKHTTSPTVTGSSVLGVKYDGGVMIACDTLGSYGSLARFPGLSRMLRVNDKTVMASDGDYADFQYLSNVIKQKVISDECAADGVEYTGASLHSWLTRVLYYRRSRLDPFWNTIVVAGAVRDQLTDIDKPFLGYVNKIGVAYEAPSVATGYGAYIAQPLIRDALERKPVLTEADARQLLTHCMTVLYYRDARAWNKFELAVIPVGKPAVIEKPLETPGDWNVARQIRGYE